MLFITENIPSEIGNLTLLKELYLNGIRQLSGTIPSELGRLSYLGMDRLILCFDA